MRMLRPGKYAAILLLFLFSFSGCGYTTRSLLPSQFKTIYIDNFANKINVTAESNDMRMYRGYRPGMELEATRKIRDKYIFDGNLKVVDSKDADLILTGELVDYRNEALRFDRNDNVEEYRVRLVVNMQMATKDGKVRWTEVNFAGEQLYRTSGPLASTETQAISQAGDDLARRVVERTVEEW